MSGVWSPNAAFARPPSEQPGFKVCAQLDEIRLERKSRRDSHLPGRERRVKNPVLTWIATVEVVARMIPPLGSRIDSQPPTPNFEFARL